MHPPEARHPWTPPPRDELPPDRGCWLWGCRCRRCLALEARDAPPEPILDRSDDPDAEVPEEPRDADE